LSGGGEFEAIGPIVNSVHLVWLLGYCVLRFHTAVQGYQSIAAFSAL
jgi:hypothetical protein